LFLFVQRWEALDGRQTCTCQWPAGVRSSPRSPRVVCITLPLLRSMAEFHQRALHAQERMDTLLDSSAALWGLAVSVLKEHPALVNQPEYMRKMGMHMPQI